MLYMLKSNSMYYHTTSKLVSKLLTNVHNCACMCLAYLQQYHAIFYLGEMFWVPSREKYVVIVKEMVSICSEYGVVILCFAPFLDLSNLYTTINYLLKNIRYLERNKHVIHVS